VAFLDDLKRKYSEMIAPVGQRLSNLGNTAKANIDYIAANVQPAIQQNIVKPIQQGIQNVQTGIQTRGINPINTLSKNKALVDRYSSLLAGNKAQENLDESLKTRLIQKGNPGADLGVFNNKWSSYNQDEKNYLTKQLANVGSMSSGIGAGKENFALNKNQLSYFKSLPQEARTILGKFAQMVEDNPGANRKNLGLVADYAQTVAEEAFGKNHVGNMTNKQLKNLIDLSLQSADNYTGKWKLVAGLQSRNAREGLEPKVMKERGLVTSVQEASNVAEPTKVAVAGKYVVKPNTKLMGEAEALLQDGATIDFKNTSNLDKKVAATIQQAINLDKAGDHNAAASLYNNLAEHATELGRGVQAFSLLDKMSPEAIALSAAGKINRYNATHSAKIPQLSGEQTKLIADQVNAIRQMATGREKNIAISQLENTINSFIPSSLTDKVITVWKAGLLTSLRTHERNLVGNTIMAGAETIKDPIAVAADKLMSLKTGQRTVTATMQGTGQGTKKGIQAASDIVKLGFDPEETINKFDLHQINWGKHPVEQALKKYTDAVFRTLGAEDKPFYNAALARSLYDQAGAEAINAGKQGNKAFIENLVNNPTENMLTTAIKDASYATFKDQNKISGLANSIKRWSRQNWYTNLPTEVVAPFTGVPSSIIGKTIDYSPIGLVKGITNMGRVMVGNVPELQRQAAQEIGRGVMGTGLFGLGSYLMSKGVMTGQPKDAKEADLWQAQGKQANSVLVGGKWRSINSVGPQTLVILAGAKYKEEMSSPEGSIGNYAFGLGKDQLNQTFLSGVQQPLNALTDPARYGKSYVGNQTASLIPNIIKDTSKALDPYARENNSTLDYVKSGIPGLRNTLIPKRDVLGNVVKQEPTGLNAFFDLFNSKTPVSNKVVDELGRLYKAGDEAIPTKLNKNQTILKQKVTLTAQQLNSLEAGSGELVRQSLDKLISSPSYQSLDDEQKAKAIDNVVKQSRSVYKAQNGQEIINSKDTKSGQVKAQETTTVKPITGLSKPFVIASDTGSVRVIDLSKPIETPTYTGNSLLDKKLKSQYASAISSRQKDIVDLYQDGQLTKEKAVELLNSTEVLKSSTKSPKKVKAIKVTLPKSQLIKVKSVKRKKLVRRKLKKVRKVI
jgi:hypothetical protein